MSELSRSSKIRVRACLLDISTDESDMDNGRNSDVGTDVEDFPAADLSSSLPDYSSCSGEEYNPNLDQNQYNDSGDNIQVSNQPDSSIVIVGRSNCGLDNLSGSQFPLPDSPILWVGNLPWSGSFNIDSDAFLMRMFATVEAIVGRRSNVEEKYPSLVRL
ncbi:hypothetical protein J6590_048658 [Homalodisca vitripennis]|nr:hypothetical protein J6590_048658 [Homalodisca vitripennis]